MNPFIHLNPDMYGKYSTGADEADVLQADVMRFMAILGICLMIIFALVKAIPMTPPDTSPVIEPPDSLNREIQQLENKIKILRSELANILSDIEDAEQKKSATTHALFNIKKELEKSEQNLVTMGKELKEQKTSLSKVRKEVKKEAVNIRKQEQEIARKSKTKSVSVPDDAVQEGFVLRFVSDEALTDLIQKRIIRFYAMTGKEARMIRIKNDHVSYLKSTYPASFYEMAPQTVPESYIRNFKKAVAVLGTDVTWGVTLPVTIRKSINAQMTGKKGGTLVIQANGQVVYKRSM